MDKAALRAWLAEPRDDLVAAVARGVRDHLDSLKARGIEYYGYAINPGEPYRISSLVGITNREADIKAPQDNDQYWYYRFCVDEWNNWDHGQFKDANRLLADTNEQFASMHAKDDPSNYMMDEFQISHSRGLLEAVVAGLQTAKKDGLFGNREPFLAVWIQDSANTMLTSVRRLNSKAVYQQFKKVFDV